jgi:DNA-binding response OmpR family regulator
LTLFLARAYPRISGISGRFRVPRTRAASLVDKEDAFHAHQSPRVRERSGNLGCSTTVVDDGNVGLQQASSDRPDLILLSIELPRMNGFSVCNKLKKDANLKEVPLIIMSSESSDETFEQHKKLRTRAEDYVHKPIAFGELLRHIREFVTIGAAPSEEGVIVIDDEIEVGAADYVVDEDKPRGSRADVEAG